MRVGVGVTNRLHRLEVGAEEEMIVIPKKGGTVARFSQRAGEEARTSPDPRWIGSFYSAFPMGEAEDLS